MFSKKMHISLTFFILSSILTLSCKCITFAPKSFRLNSKIIQKDITPTSQNIQTIQFKETTRPTLSDSQEQVSQDVPSTAIYDKVEKLHFIDNNIPTITMYRIINSVDGSTCILLTMDGLISFNYTTKFNGVEETDTFVPSANESGVVLSGDCGNGEKSSMLLTWKTFALSFYFTKTPGREKWYVSRIRLNFSTKESTFKHPVYDNSNVSTSSAEEKMLFPTPVGRSFKCHKEIEVSLSDPEYPDLKVKLMLRKLTLQPFMFKTDNFGPEYLCTAAESFRSETVPFVFGIFMTIAVLCAVGGYAAYRSYRVEKVQYNSME